MAERTVLVADDSASVVRQLARILEESGRYKVVGMAADGLEAVRMFREHRPQLVCMDVIMPNMDGIGALRVMRQFDAAAQIVMISSVGGVAGKVEECLRNGAANVISKPFEKDKVLQVLDAL